jgi:hypothetical protein
MINKQLLNGQFGKSLIFLLLVFNLGNICKVYSQPNKCRKFRNGTFTIALPEYRNYLVKRNGKTQSESDQNDKSTYLVTWIDDCTYTLKPTKETLRLTPGFPKNGYYKVKIIQVKENSYIQTTTTNFSDLKLTVEMTKI